MKFRKDFRSEKGQGFVEYLFIVGLIALMIFVVIKTFGNKVGEAFNRAGDKVTEATQW